MPIPDSFIDDLVSATDIADLVGGYVKLEKRSGSNIFALCPFHSEKTPSFAVNPDRQMYYCFGCGKGGGAINFVMEIENLPFRDAIEIMAKRVGMTVPEDSGAGSDLAEKRRRMLDLNRAAARHFHEMLSSPLAGDVRSYLAQRRVSKAMVTKFGLGAAPDSWTLLLDAMMGKGYSKQELIEAGLARSGQQKDGAYDMFRNRLIFPVIDVRGEVIGFSGRIIGDGEPKYLNSPDTIVFSKSKNLFGLNLARKSKAGMLILTEGNMDVVALHQHGFDSAVASLGTSMTADQARLMSRYSSNAVIAFDSDEAGKRATLRAIPLLEKTGMGIKVVGMGDAKDPDEFLTKHSPDAFRTLIEGSENHVEYRLMVIQNSHDTTTDEGRLRYIAAATELLSELGSKPEREVYGARVAKTAGISTESIDHEVEKKIGLRNGRERREQEKRIMQPAGAARGSMGSPGNLKQHSAAAEEGLIRSLIKDSALMEAAAEMGFSEEEFTSDFLAKVFGVLSKRISQDRDTREALVLSEFENDEAERLSSLLNKNEALHPSRQTIRDYIDRIREDKFKTKEPDSATLLELMLHKEKKDIGGN